MTHPFRIRRVFDSSISDGSVDGALLNSGTRADPPRRGRQRTPYVARWDGAYRQRPAAQSVLVV